jgi:hypothetical protein
LLAPRFVWRSQSGAADPWYGLVLSARCDKEGAAIPAFETIAAVPNAGEEKALSVASCSGVFDKVEFKLAPASGQDSAFSRTNSIEFMANQ